MKKLLIAVCTGTALLLTMALPNASYAKEPTRKEEKRKHKGKIKPTKKIKHHKKAHRKAKKKSAAAKK